MYSPKERIYTTPELTGPAGSAVMQQLRLEAILRKYGRLDSCEPYVYTTGKTQITNNTLPEITTPLRTLRQEPAGTTWEKLWQGLAIPRKESKHHRQQSPEKMPGIPGCSEDAYNKNRRSRIPGAPSDDPYLQKHRDTVGGCKYGGVNLTQHADKNDSTVLFRPFLPQKSPLRLPCIQREKSKQPTTLTLKPPTLTNRDVSQQINVFQKNKTKGWSRQQAEEDAKKRKKRVKREQEFHQWEQSQDAYLQKVHAFDADQQILENFERFHNVTGAPGAPGIDAEQTQRTRISDEIRRGVRERKLNIFKDGDPNLSQENNLIPVCNMTFAKEDVETFDQKKTLVQNVKVQNVKVHKKGKVKKKHLL